METRKYLFETLWKQYLLEQEEEKETKEEKKNKVNNDVKVYWNMLSPQAQDKWKTWENNKEISGISDDSDYNYLNGTEIKASMWNKIGTLEPTNKDQMNSVQAFYNSLNYLQTAYPKSPESSNTNNNISNDKSNYDPENPESSLYSDDW